MAGTIKFDPVPRLPTDWWLPVPKNSTEIEAQNRKNVWPIWGEHNCYFWGANAGNQFVDRGQSLAGGGMAGSNGPSRGIAHPQYVGYDTMSDPNKSKAGNGKVISEMMSWLDAGHTVIIPTYPNRFSLGTGIAIDNPNATSVQAAMWADIISLINHASNVSYIAELWTPDMAQASGSRKGTNIPLPDLVAIKAYHNKLVTAAAS